MSAPPAVVDSAYASGPRLLLQGTLRKLVASPDGSQTWEYRHVAIFPTAVHVYRAAGVPAEGTRPKTLIPLAGACVEVVHPDDTGILASAARPFTFSLIPAGSLAETVMSAGGPAELERWMDECARAVYLAGHAAARGLTIVATSSDGLRLRNAAGAHVATAADVFAGISSATVNASVTSLARAGGSAGARPTAVPTTLRAPAPSNRSLVGAGVGLSTMSGVGGSGGGGGESVALVSGTSPAAGAARRKEARVSPQSVDAPPAPPQRGGGTNGSVYTSARAPSPGESMLSFQDASTLPNMASSSSRAAKATDMPKPKFAQWAETGGVPAAAARGERERLAREAVVAAANAAPTRRGVKFADEPGVPAAPLPTFGVGGGGGGGELALGLPPTGDRPPPSYPQLGGSLVSLAVRSTLLRHRGDVACSSMRVHHLTPPPLFRPTSCRPFFYSFRRRITLAARRTLRPATRRCQRPTGCSREPRVLRRRIRERCLSAAACRR